MTTLTILTVCMKWSKRSKRSEQILKPDGIRRNERREKLKRYENSSNGSHKTE